MCQLEKQKMRLIHNYTPFVGSSVLSSDAEDPRHSWKRCSLPFYLKRKKSRVKKEEQLVHYSELQ